MLACFFMQMAAFKLYSLHFQVVLVKKGEEKKINVTAF